MTPALLCSKLHLTSRNSHPSLTYRYRGLQSDQLGRIYVGEESSKPFLVQQSHLTEASDYFVKAIRNEAAVISVLPSSRKMT